MSYQDSFIDYAGVEIIVDWAKKLWLKHLAKHPEISDTATASKLIRDALRNPSLVIKGEKPGDGETLACYYKEHKRYKNDVYYTKVVVGCNRTPLYVKTVFLRWALAPLAVQEKKYNFEELYRDPATYL